MPVARRWATQNSSPGVGQALPGGIGQKGSAHLERDGYRSVSSAVLVSPEVYIVAVLDELGHDELGKDDDAASPVQTT
jgi:hypothetical protein